MKKALQLSVLALLAAVVLTSGAALVHHFNPAAGVVQAGGLPPPLCPGSPGCPGGK